ncbi:MEMO1 family [Pavlovales sp. CCMP2436]|nr:MEMO1 family [Pavlovales sp. CCMP2436]
MTTRRATHAGSWYASDGEELAGQLRAWLDAVEPSAGRARAVIAPHAGFAYSGPTAAYAYKHIDPEVVRRVFLLGPSHHVHLHGCALTGCASYETPLGRIAIDRATNGELAQAGFETMALDTDEAEHSLELHLPYIQAVMGSRSFQLVPVLVGSLAPADAERYGQLLAPYLADPQTVFVVSSDFINNYICEGIEALDRRAMDLIAEQDAAGFHAYQRETRNTICGQHPISLLLHSLGASPQRHLLSWVKYAQSSKVTRNSDSSVSYASAVIELA